MTKSDFWSAYLGLWSGRWVSSTRGNEQSSFSSHIRGSREEVEDGDKNISGDSRRNAPNAMGSTKKSVNQSGGNETWPDVSISFDNRKTGHIIVGNEI